MKVGSSQKKQKGSSIQDVRPTASSTAGAGSGAKNLLEEFRGVLDNFAARSFGDPSADEAFSEALQIGGQVQSVPAVIPVAEIARSNSGQQNRQVSANTEPTLGQNAQEGRQAVVERSGQNSEEVGQRDLNQGFKKPNEASSNAEERTQANTQADQKENLTTTDVDSASEEVSAPTVQEASIAEQAKMEGADAGVELAQSIESEQFGIESNQTEMTTANMSGATKSADTEGSQVENTSASTAADESVEINTAGQKTEDTAESPEAPSDSIEQIQLDIAQLRASEAGPLQKNADANAKQTAATPDIQRLTADVLALKLALDASISNRIISPAVERVVEESQVKDRNSIGALNNNTVRNNPSTDSAMLKDAKAAKQHESRSLRPLTAANSSRTMEKVENALREAAKARDGKTISLRLDPPNLGRIKVDVSIKDGNLHARVVAETPAVNQLLRERVYDLQGALRKLGLNVDQVSVSIGGVDSADLSFDSAVGQQGQRRQEEANQFSQKSGLEQPLVAQVGTSRSEVVVDHWVA